MTYAIPTKWNGVQFRSRLEARWAAFFTAIGWEWSYEPIDLQGYIPDFLLHLDEDVLVEVKPFTSFDDDVILEAETEIQDSGWSGPFGVVGVLFTGFWVGPHLVCDGLCNSCFEWNGRQRPGHEVWRLAEDSNRKRCLVCGRSDIASDPDEGGNQFCDQGIDYSLEIAMKRVTLWRNAGTAVLRGAQ